MNERQQDRILVVDDEPMIRSFVREILEDAGYTVVEAGCIDAAFLLLAGDHIRLVISDIELPDGNGLELAATVRRKWPDKRLVVMSARTLPLPDQLPQSAVMLCKPFSEERLLAVVRSTLCAAPNRPQHLLS